MSILERLKGLMGGPRPISCQDALRVVQEYLDGELEGVSEESVREHFEVCEGCYPQLRLETVFRGAVRRAAVGDQAPDELRRKVAELLRESDAAD